VYDVRAPRERQRERGPDGLIEEVAVFHMSGRRRPRNVAWLLPVMLALSTAARGADTPHASAVANRGWTPQHRARYIDGAIARYGSADKRHGLRERLHRRIQDTRRGSGSGLANTSIPTRESATRASPPPPLGVSPPPYPASPRSSPPPLSPHAPASLGFLPGRRAWRRAAHGDDDERAVAAWEDALGTSYKRSVFLTREQRLHRDILQRRHLTRAYHLMVAPDRKVCTLQVGWLRTAALTKP
jgi:hypothetical protein